ncbi:MAG: hypothetical protein WBA67_06095 [Jannaschia sp.]
MSRHPFGSFNPNFYGISQSLDGPETMSVLRGYAQQDDISQWHAAQADFDLARLGAISATDHEVRHFHDSLLSPWAMQTMFYRLQATANGQSAIKALMATTGGAVPTPITRWMTWSDADRERWLRFDGARAGLASEADLVSLPRIDFDIPMGRRAQLLSDAALQDQFALLAEACARSYRSLEIARAPLDTGLGIHVSATGIFEATAHIVQGVAIHSGQGLAPYHAFMKQLTTSTQAHLVPFQILMRALMEGGNIVPAKRITELFTWMLLGPVGHPDEEGHPAQRFAVVLMLAAAGAATTLLDLPATSTATVWDTLDEATGLRSWRLNLLDAKERMAERAALIEQTFGTQQTTPAIAEDALVIVARRWHQDLGRMVDAVIADPDHYCDPEVYLQDWTGRIPAPMVLMHYGRHAYRMDPEPLAREDVRVIRPREDAEEILCLIHAPFHDRATHLLDAVTNLYQVQKIIDYAFYEEATHRAVDAWFHQIGQSLTNRRFLHIF